jgi:hypothetical protein
MKNKFNKIAIIATIAVFIALIMTSCTDAQRARVTGYGAHYKVEMYSGGKMVREWISSGKVHSEEGSDGYYFNDKVSGQLIEVTGDVVITQL